MADLLEGELVVIGRHPLASNLAVVGEVRGAEDAHLVVYKPTRGEQPLWDFPEGSLAAREVATCRVDALGGFGLVPPTVLRDGPLGPGAVQQWIGEVERPAPTPVVVTRPDEVPEGNIVVLGGEDEDGSPVVVSHPDEPRLRSMAVLDAVINNSDRKGGHILLTEDGLWGIDHGVSLHADPKLRTVLWGWAGEPLVDEDLARLARLSAALGEDAVRTELVELITPRELAALEARVAELVRSGRHPDPSGGWPAIPWPPL